MTDHEMAIEIALMVIKYIAIFWTCVGIWAFIEYRSERRRRGRRRRYQRQRMNCKSINISNKARKGERTSLTVLSH